MYDFIVCVPSYKRAETCRDKTLTMLRNNNIDKSIINVFVANKTEHDKYKEILDKDTYGNLIVGKKGLIQQRSFIQKYYKEGQKILFLDDDVESVDLSLSTMFKNNTLSQFVNKAFEICKENESNIWGIYPVFNPFFR